MQFNRLRPGAARAETRSFVHVHEMAEFGCEMSCSESDAVPVDSETSSGIRKPRLGFGKPRLGFGGLGVRAIRRSHAKLQGGRQPPPNPLATAVRVLVQAQHSMIVHDEPT